MPADLLSDAEGDVPGALLLQVSARHMLFHPAQHLGLLSLPMMPEAHIQDVPAQRWSEASLDVLAPPTDQEHEALSRHSALTVPCKLCARFQGSMRMQTELHAQCLTPLNTEILATTGCASPGTTHQQASCALSSDSGISFLSNCVPYVSTQNCLLHAEELTLRQSGL